MENPASDLNTGSAEKSDLTIGIAIHPELPIDLRCQLTIDIIRPLIDENFITDIVGSQSPQKLRLIINHHRELLNTHLGAQFERLKCEQIAQQSLLRRLRVQVFRCRVVFYLTNTWTWFPSWPSWSIWMFLTLILIGMLMTIASGVGVYTLLCTTATFADSRISCAIVSSLVAGCVFGIKCGIAVIESDVWRRRCRKTLAVLTALLALAYFTILAFFTGGLGAGTLTVYQLAHGAPTDSFSWLSPYLQTGQLFLEAVAALMVFSFADLLVEKHGPPNRVFNPAKVLRMRQFVAASKAKKSTEIAIGLAKGLRRQLRSERNCFVMRARAIFERKAKLSKSQEEGIRRQRGEPISESPPSFVRRVQRLFAKT